MMRESLRRGSLTGTLLFFSVILAGSLIILLSRRPVPANHLTGAMVKRHRQRLSAMAERTTIDAPASDDFTHIVYTFGRTDRTFQALAIKSQLTRRGKTGTPEGHLSFALDVSPPEPLRNPRRPQRSSIFLLRSDIGCDLVKPADPRSLFLHFDGQGSTQPGRSRELALSNVRGGSRLAVRKWSTDDLPGIDPNASFGFCDRDLYVFTLLPRILRARIWDPGSPAMRCYNTVLLVYRQTQPNRYLIDLKLQKAESGSVRYMLSVAVNGRGELVRGGISRLPSTLKKRGELFFVHPRPSGELLRTQDAGFFQFKYEPHTRHARTEVREVDFAALLRDTRW